MYVDCPMYMLLRNIHLEVVEMGYTLVYHKNLNFNLFNEVFFVWENFYQSINGCFRTYESKHILILVKNLRPIFLKQI